MIDTKLLDSSIWLAYLFNGSCRDLIDSEEIFLLSALSLFEIKKKLSKNRLSTPKINKSMDFVKKRSLILPVTAEISEKAVETAALPMADALIYTTAVLQEATLVTLDNDFKGLKGVLIPTL